MLTHAVEAAGPVVVWLVDTAFSAVFGLALGLLIVVIVTGASRLFRREKQPAAAH